MTKSSRNERLKLRATLLNGVAIGLLVSLASAVIYALGEWMGL